MSQIFQWQQAAAFCDRVERLELHGLHFQHVTLCHRRAWLYMHHINFAQWNSLVQKGAARHLSSYKRDHSTLGLFGLAPDRLDWENRIVYENKGTGGAIEASANQTAFYALMLSIASGYAWQASVHVLSTRRKRAVPMDEHRLNCLWQASEKLEELYMQESPPHADKIALCRSCSQGAFCGYDD